LVKGNQQIRETPELTSNACKTGKEKIMIRVSIFPGVPGEVEPSMRKVMTPQDALTKELIYRLFYHLDAHIHQLEDARLVVESSEAHFVSFALFEGDGLEMMDLRIVAQWYAMATGRCDDSIYSQLPQTH
jgi:hypothetical protein